MATSERDIVFDSFAGSGTTGAVAHKMNRRWIMVELGEHAETLGIPRLKRVVSGKDQSGISKVVNWKGGGGFKYYKLGESLIKDNNINWNLTCSQVAESIYYVKNFKLLKDKTLEKRNIFVGKNLYERDVYALSIVSKELDFIRAKEYSALINYLKKAYPFKTLNIYTNKAVNVLKDEQDDSVFIKKIPQTILKRYNLI